VVVAAVMAILAAAALPVVRFTVTRTKEADLRQHLRTMRNAIDEYKRYSDAGLIPVDLGTDGYPSELETLVEGVEIVGQVDMEKKFLRRIPVDPMTGEAEWGTEELPGRAGLDLGQRRERLRRLLPLRGSRLERRPLLAMVMMTMPRPTQPPPPPPCAKRQRGFTIIELIIVVAIIGILAAMAMPMLKDQPLRAKEAVLKTNLRTLRDVLDQYKGDKGHYPSELDTLVEEGYLREIPIDPIDQDGGLGPGAPGGDDVRGRAGRDRRVRGRPTRDLRRPIELRAASASTARPTASGDPEDRHRRRADGEPGSRRCDPPRQRRAATTWSS
jgi:prepilin-type N-terminal cleavage/methylation domain-containing protein